MNKKDILIWKFKSFPLWKFVFWKLKEVKYTKNKTTFIYGPRFE